MKNNGSPIQIKLISLGEVVRESKNFIIKLWREYRNKDAELLQKHLAVTEQAISRCIQIQAAYRAEALTEEQKEALTEPLLESVKALFESAREKRIINLNLTVYIILAEAQQTGQAGNAKEHNELKSELRRSDSRRAS